LTHHFRPSHFLRRQERTHSHTGRAEPCRVSICPTTTCSPASLLCSVGRTMVQQLPTFCGAERAARGCSTRRRQPHQVRDYMPAILTSKCYLTRACMYAAPILHPLCYRANDPGTAMHTRLEWRNCAHDQPAARPAWQAPHCCAWAKPPTLYR
jgi:hypothetical protein